VIKVEKAVNSLGQLESEVIAALFPADGRDPATFEMIAERLGMTMEEVKGIADNALRGLRGGRALARISNAWN
jgi:DNA-directed RNA polymerase sigma subunit (sigma70/sigma32)